MGDDKLSMVVLLSGNGSNLQAILDATARPGFPARIAAVISNRPDAYGLERAKRAGIATEALDHKAFPDRASFDAALRECIDRHHPDLLVLAGFMRILGDDFVRHYEGRMLNIHPSLLPKYRGLHTHQRAIEAGETWHGASVHFVTPELDGGPVVLQARVPVHVGDDPRALAERVLGMEHQIYPEVIRWIAEGRLQWRDHRPWLDGQALERPVTRDWQAA